MPLVNLVEQEAGDFGQTRFGVAHGGRAVAVTRTKIALPVDQRVALRKILRHAHQGVIGRLIAMGVEAAQHIAHHAGAFDRLGAGIAIGSTKAQAHARHAVQNPPLHRLLAVAHIGQGAAFDHAQGVFQISALRIVGKVELVVAIRCGGEVENRLVSHAGLFTR